MTVSEETKKALQGLRTEIVAGKILFPQTEVDRAWNSCADRALRILDKYAKGEGLLQGD